MHVQKWACILLFKELGVFQDVRAPKRLHQPFDIFWPILFSIWKLTAQPPDVHYPGKRSARIWRKPGARRFVRYALRGDVELITRY
jgi:hypothetical protein